MDARRGESAVWVSWLQWAVATAVGSTVGWLLGAGLVMILHGSWVPGGIIVGAVIGLMQGIVLKRRGYSAGWWILTSAIGWSVGLEYTADWSYKLTVVFDQWLVAHAWNAAHAMGGAAGGLLGGALVGLMQWFLLRHWVCRSGWWVLASAVGWSAGWAVRELAMYHEFLIGAVAGSVAGVITGGAMAWLLRHPRLSQQ